MCPKLKNVRNPSEKDLNDMEALKIPDAEFKTMFISTIKSLFKSMFKGKNG